MPSQYALPVGCEDDVVAIPMILLVSRTGVWTPTLMTRKKPAGVTIWSIREIHGPIMSSKISGDIDPGCNTPCKSGRYRQTWSGHLMSWL